MLRSAFRKANVIVIVAVAASILVGCGRQRGDRVCVARSRGTCTVYERSPPTALETMKEDSDRAVANREGRPYIPRTVAGETPAQHLGRITEERDRHEAEQRGQQYIAPQRAGESTSAWFKRASKVQRSTSGSSSFGPAGRR